MSKQSIRLFVGAVLGVFGVGLLLLVVPLLGTPVTGLWSFAGRAVQSVLAIVAAIAVVTEQPWAAVAIVATGVAVAVTALGDAFVVGITAPLAAVAVALVAVAVAVLLAGAIRRAA